jgi:hypothetical protein
MDEAELERFRTVVSAAYLADLDELHRRLMAALMPFVGKTVTVEANKEIEDICREVEAQWLAERDERDGTTS